MTTSYKDGNDLDRGRIEYEKTQADVGQNRLGLKHDFKVFTYKLYALGVAKFDNEAGLICLPNDLTNDQALAIEGSYIKNTTSTNEAAAKLILDSLYAEYPCQKSEKTSHTS